MELLDYYRQQKISLRYRTLQAVLKTIREKLPDDEQESVERLESVIDGLLKNAEVSVPGSPE